MPPAHPIIDCIRSTGIGSFEYCYHSSSSDRMEKFSGPIAPLVEEEDCSSMRQKNPFLIANVLEVIYQYLDHNTLKSCRRVSQLWSVLATPLVRHSSLAHLEGPFWDQRSENFLQTMISSSSNILPMSSIVYNVRHHGFSDRNVFFFTNFGHSLSSLVLQAYALQTPADSLATTRFIQVLALIVGRDCPNLKSLTLTNLDNLDYTHGYSDPQDTRLDFIHPNIKHLNISFGKLNTPRSALNCMTLFKKFLTILPNIEVLETEYKNSGELLVYFLQTLRDSNVSEKLVELSVEGGPFDSSAFNIMNQMKFPKLKVLKINPHITKDDKESFQTFLTSISSTLEKIVILSDKPSRYSYVKRNQRRQEKVFMEFPPMPKLTSLHQENYEGFRMDNSKFLKNLPNLTEMVIRDMQPSLGDIMLCSHLTLYGSLFGPVVPKNLTPSPLLKKLAIDAVYIPCIDNLSMINILTTFPNLEELELCISFGDRNIHIGRALDILSHSKLKSLRIKFYQCTQLMQLSLAIELNFALMNKIPQFTDLERLELILEDIPAMSRFNISLPVIESMVLTKKLNFLYLTGFGIGVDSAEADEGRYIMDNNLAQWKLCEQLTGNYSYY